MKKKEEVLSVKVKRMYLLQKLHRRLPIAKDMAECVAIINMVDEISRTGDTIVV